MKRTPLKRGKALAVGKGSLRRTPMKRGAGSGKRKPTPARPPRTAAEQAAMNRDGRTCQRCGINLTDIMASKHHRKRRREADADTVQNIVLLCGSGTTGCHGFVTEHPRTAHREGWVCWTFERPDVRPCLTAYGSTGAVPPNGNYTSMKMFLADGQVIEDMLPPIPLRASGDEWPMWTATAP